MNWDNSKEVQRFSTLQIVWCQLFTEIFQFNFFAAKFELILLLRKNDRKNLMLNFNISNVTFGMFAALF